VRLTRATTVHQNLTDVRIAAHVDSPNTTTARWCSS
jgi:hypothetical protein